MPSATLARIRNPQVMIGLFLAALLLFAVVGVVRELTTMPTTALPLQNSALGGVQAVQGSSEPLPAFSLSQSQQPAPLPVYSVTANEPKPLTVAMPEWLAVKRGDQVGDRKVFAGWWFLCSEITMDGRWLGQGAGTHDWSLLTIDQRMAVVQRCMQADINQPLPVLPTATLVVHQWLDTITDSTGERWVWIGEWFVACDHITPDYIYHNDRDLEAVAVWNRLPFDDQTEVRSKCRE